MPVVRAHMYNSKYKYNTNVSARNLAIFSVHDKIKSHIIKNYLRHNVERSQRSTEIRNKGVHKCNLYGLKTMN